MFYLMNLDGNEEEKTLKPFLESRRCLGYLRSMTSSPSPSGKELQVQLVLGSTTMKGYRRGEGVILSPYGSLGGW